MTTLTPLKASLLPCGSRDQSRGAEYVLDMFKKYNIRTYAVLVDHTSIAEDLEDIGLNGFECAGYFSFDLFLEGEEFNAQSVKLISLDDHIPVCDGWIILSTSRGAVIGLNQGLLNQNKEHQVIVRLYTGQTTQVTAYMDLFSGETETIQYINHYYNRIYRIVYPLDLRYIVYTPEGNVVRAGQRIIQPGGLTVFDTRDMDLGQFQGYMRVFLEVENLQVRVQPFLHYWADYISDAGMTRNHQSGWGPHPPESVFSLGYVPTHPDYELVTSFFNEGDAPIQPKLILHFKDQEGSKIIERDAEVVMPNEMSYQNVSRIFKDIEVTNLNATYVLTTCDLSMHRPNQYIMVKGTNKCVDTFHETKCAGKYIAKKSDYYNWTNDELKRLQAKKIYAGLVPFPILDQTYGIETYIALLSGSISDTTDFEYHVRNEHGEIIHVDTISFYENSPKFLNLNQYLKKQEIHLGTPSGSVNLVPNGPDIPVDIPFMIGFKHQQGPNISTSFQSSARPGNLPFYICSDQFQMKRNRPASREYRFSPVQTNLVFGNGIIDDEYDSFFLFSHASLMEDYTKVCHYRIEILDSKGKLYSTNRTIKPFTWDFFFISELLNEMDISLDGSSFTLWSNSYDTKIPSYQGLYRKHDHAMSIDDMSQGTLMKEPQV